MKKETKLYGSTATYLQELEVNKHARKISETYEVDLQDLAQAYSDMQNVPTQLNKDKKFEIQALARSYLKAQPQDMSEFPEAEFDRWFDDAEQNWEPVGPTGEECARWAWSLAMEKKVGKR